MLRFEIAEAIPVTVQMGRVVERAAGGAVRLFQLPINPLTGPTCRLLNVADEDGRLGNYTITY